MRTVSPPLRGLAATLLALVLAFSACSGDDEPEEPGPTGTATSPDAKPLATKAKVGEITGKLPKKNRKELVARVTDVVDGWWDAAYLTVDAKNPFPGFTKGAAKLAQRNAGIMTNAHLVKDGDTVVATRRVVTVDALAARRKPAGVTAKVLLVLKTDGKKDRRVTVRGTLELVRDKDGWKVFAYRMTATPKEIS